MIANWRAETIAAGVLAKVPSAPITRALRRLTVEGAEDSRNGLWVMMARPFFGPPLMNSIPVRIRSAMGRESTRRARDHARRYDPAHATPRAGGGDHRGRARDRARHRPALRRGRRAGGD